jgi:hypothetical protein
MKTIYSLLVIFLVSTTINAQQKVVTNTGQKMVMWYLVKGKFQDSVANIDAQMSFSNASNSNIFWRDSSLKAKIFKQDSISSYVGFILGDNVKFPSDTTHEIWLRIFINGNPVSRSWDAKYLVQKVTINQGHGLIPRLEDTKIGVVAKIQESALNRSLFQEVR